MRNHILYDARELYPSTGGCPYRPAEARPPRVLGRAASMGDKRLISDVDVPAKGFEGSFRHKRTRQTLTNAGGDRLPRSLAGPARPPRAKNSTRRSSAPGPGRYG